MEEMPSLRFRKYLDFEAYEAMRNLHAQLRKKWTAGNA